MRLVDAIISGKLDLARELFEERVEQLIEEKLAEYENGIVLDDEDYEDLDEANILKMGRMKIVRLRVRGGKVQRRKKFSTVPGYTFRGGRMVRMSALERRHRKMAARRAKVKRRGKMSQTLRKRRMSLRKRKAMGVK